ncbi:hypothetical protein NPIL_67921 [Nephila pilipes]|uniref:tRNA (cytosine(34)-C(5))-methyltransferase n=1 Tax=Nephila pilipes TaxID=299642 RepID=A0A8X6TZS0_NEPPI|nr:hypothetical protein NPIL_67921 [Nephila pilipes]
MDKLGTDVIPRGENVERTILKVTADLHNSRKMIKTVNLSALPDKGARLKNRVEDLEKLLESLTLQADSECDGEKNTAVLTNFENDFNSIDSKKLDMCENSSKITSNSEKNCNKISCNKKTSKPLSDHKFGAAPKLSSKLSPVNSKAENKNVFVHPFDIELASFDKLSKSAPKLEDPMKDLVNSPSFKNYRTADSNSRIKLTEAKPLYEPSVIHRHQKILYSAGNPRVLANEETVRKLHSSLCTFPDDAEEITEPELLRTPLLTHQIKGLSWLVWRETQQPSGGILADDMGLGKTLTMISLILKQNEAKNYLREKGDYSTRATLIVCLASIVHQWGDEITKHCEDGALKVLLYHGPKRERDISKMKKYKVVVTTYSTLLSEMKALVNNQIDSGLFNLKWERVILDEAHTVKNYKSKTAEAVFRLMSYRRWCVTGTPIHNEFKDMYSLIKFLQFSPFDDEKKWKALISDDTESSNKRRDLLVKSILLRRTKEDEDKSGKPMIQMVKKTMNLCNIELSVAEQAVYDQLDSRINELVNKLLNKPSRRINATSSLLVLLLRLQQCCCHVSLLGEEAEDLEDSVNSSVNELSMNMSSLAIGDSCDSSTSDSESSLDLSFSEYLSGKLSNPLTKSSKIQKLFEKLDEIAEKSGSKDKSVIVSQWVSLLNIVARHLDKDGVKYHMIAGSTKAEDRQKASYDFNYNDNGCKILLLSLRAGGVGLNLVGGNHLFLLDLHWNPALERQACDRIHRVGQTKKVFIYKFVCQNTIEQKILSLQEKKSELASDVLHGAGKNRGIRQPYKDIIKENENFEKYYKIQGIVPSEEWESFMKSLRENLPATFRITGFKGEAKALLNIIKGKYFQDLMKIKDENADSYKPFSLPWYPGDLAWQMKLSRVTIRSSECLRQLHNFLVSETDTGNISRQETVSMIPPLLLGVEPHHKVFDMCAAPGSKTAQLIEFLHRNDGKIPDGLIVANDLDNKRCYMLVHQAKRLNSPCLLITNNDAANFPNIKIKDGEKLSNLKFDRILCDVPCSGDGTLRKTVEIWTKWNAANGNNMHGLQLRILRRGLELLAPGGRIVYSTCSFNPVENEAVIATTLQETKGSVELLDVRSSLPGLKTKPGLYEWQVTNKELEAFTKFEEVPEKNLTHIRPNMFPPPLEVAKELHLEHCLRILPHHQDTGGFFVAVLQKNGKLPWEKATEEIQDNTSRSPPPKKRKIWGYKEDPFIFMNDVDEIWPKMKEFYKLSDFPTSQLLSRCVEGKKRNIYFTSKIVKSIIQENLDNIKIINTGVRMLSRSENKDTTCMYRLAQEGVSTISPYMSDRKMDIKLEDLVVLLTNEYPAHTLFSEETQQKLKGVASGCLILCYTGNKRADDEFEIELCGWKGNQTLRCYIPKVGRAHYLRICGVDVSQYEMREKKKFKVKDKSAVVDADAEVLTEGQDSAININDANGTAIKITNEELTAKS